MTETDQQRMGAERRTVLKALAGAPVLAAFAPTASAMTEDQPPQETFIAHAYPEKIADLGEVQMNYAVAGSDRNPALLLIPGQTESWWGFEKAMKILEKDFQVYAVDLRGQGRSTWTPGRYTLDNMGNDLVRFIDLVIKRPVVTSGCSSGGVLSCWLSAFAKPGQVRASHYEDPPLFASEFNPLYGQSIRQAAGPSLGIVAKYLGDQWSIGDWEGAKEARKKSESPIARLPMPDAPPQNIKEYDPEWGRAFSEGTVGQSCPHHMMLSQVKVPVLFTHHGRMIDPKSGFLVGAISDLQANKAREIVTAAGRTFEYVDCPDAAHAMHAADPPRFAKLLGDWAKKLPAR